MPPGDGNDGSFINNASPAVAPEAPQSSGWSVDGVLHSISEECQHLWKAYGPPYGSHPKDVHPAAVAQPQAAVVRPQGAEQPQGQARPAEKRFVVPPAPSQIVPVAPLSTAPEVPKHVAVVGTTPANLTVPTDLSLNLTAAPGPSPSPEATAKPVLVASARPQSASGPDATTRRAEKTDPTGTLNLSPDQASTEVVAAPAPRQLVAGDPHDCTTWKPDYEGKSALAQQWNKDHADRTTADYTEDNGDYVVKWGDSLDSIVTRFLKANGQATDRASVIAERDKWAEANKDKICNHDLIYKGWVLHNPDKLASQPPRPAQAEQPVDRPTAAQPGPITSSNEVNWPPQNQAVPTPRPVTSGNDMNIGRGIIIHNEADGVVRIHRGGSYYPEQDQQSYYSRPQIPAVIDLNLQLQQRQAWQQSQWELQQWQWQQRERQRQEYQWEQEQWLLSQQQYGNPNYYSLNRGYQRGFPGQGQNPNAYVWQPEYVPTSTNYAPYISVNAQFVR